MPRFALKKVCGCDRSECSGDRGSNALDAVIVGVKIINKRPVAEQTDSASII